MTDRSCNDPDLPRLALPRRRVLQTLLGGTLTLAGLSACGGNGEGNEEGEDEETNQGGNEQQEEDEEEEEDD